MRITAMNVIKAYRIPVVVAALLIAENTAWSADTPKLIAPVYKGAVPAMSADGIKVNPGFIGTFNGLKGLDCQATNEAHDFAGRVISDKSVTNAVNYTGPWCFLSRDPIDKVKAFYDKAVGPMHAIKGTWGNPARAVQGYAVYAERAWFPGDGEAAPPGFGYTAVSLHALPPPPNVPAKEAKNTDASWQGQETYKFYAESRHFNGFIDAVDWFGDPTKRKPAELNAYYNKHKRLESALFQRKGPKLEAVDVTLRARYTEKRKQSEHNAMGMMPGQGQMPTGMPANQAASPDDEAFNAFMKKNPKVAKRYTELTQKLNTLMQQGKFDEADAADEELQKLVNSNPELAALEQRANARSASVGAANQARENQAMANYQSGMDKAIWGNWEQYINTAEKDAYYTLIVIDRAFTGKEKDYSRNQALLAKETATWSPHGEWGFSYKGQQSSNTASPAASGSQAQTNQQEKNDSEDVVTDSLKKGLKGLKGLF